MLTPYLKKKKKKKGNKPEDKFFRKMGNESGNGS
jgi:hypothetical protein